MRPDPDALLQTQTRDTAGGLRVFLGAAPGVGKTFQMLQAARALQQQGVDVVIGVAETHGRPDTWALCQGLEQLPPIALEHAGRHFQVFDLDAALQRRPAVLLLDELAHRNIPGTRHARRYQDIEELLEHGISVWSAINIQHLDSLSDVVAGITGVRMRETVPDALLERAQDLTLVDLSPAELLQRLRQGKVYLPEQAQAAIDGYFSSSNLAALRELAVQAIAERLDTDLCQSMRARGLEGPWHLRSRVLVVVDDPTQGEALARAGRRLADRRRAPWTLVSVTTGPERPATQQRLARTFELARRLGAEVRTLRGGDRVEEILAFARQQNATSLLLARPHKCWWPGCRSLGRPLLRRAEAFEIIFMPLQHRQRHPPEPRTYRPLQPASLALAAASIAAATGLSLVLEPLIPTANLTLVLLTAVLWVASRTGIRPALFSAVLGFLAYNFCFTEPRLTFSIDHRDDLLTALFFLTIAVIGGSLASRLRDQIQMLRASNHQAERHLDYTRQLASATDTAAVQRIALDQLHAQLGLPLLLARVSPDTGTLEMLARRGTAAEMDRVTRSAIDWSLRNGKPSGAFSDTLGNLPWRFEPVAADDQVYAVLGLQLEHFTPDRYHGLTITAYTQQLGLAWRRTLLSARLTAVRATDTPTGQADDSPLP